MASRVAGFDVDVSFSSPPWTSVDLRAKDSRVIGCLEPHDLKEKPLIVCASEMLRTGDCPEWSEQADVLSFGVEEIAGG